MKFISRFSVSAFFKSRLIGQLTSPFPQKDLVLRQVRSWVSKSSLYALIACREEHIRTARYRLLRCRTWIVGQCQWDRRSMSLYERYRNAYNKFPCSRSAIGASGLTITLHAPGTSTSRIALRLNLLVMDRDPSVATSLCLWDVIDTINDLSTRLTR